MGPGSIPLNPNHGNVCKKKKTQFKLRKKTQHKKNDLYFILFLLLFVSVHFYGVFGWVFGKAGFFVMIPVNFSNSVLILALFVRE